MDVSTTSSHGNSPTDGEGDENEPTIGDENHDDTQVMPVQDGEIDNVKRTVKKKGVGSKQRKEPLREMNRDGSGAQLSAVAAKKELIQQQQQEVEAYLEHDELVSNEYPKHTSTPVARVFLELTETESEVHMPLSLGVFLPDADVKCVICHQKYDNLGDDELINCHGTISGETEGVERIPISVGKYACRSKFHMRCITKYNSGGFLFQYAARLECQAKFLCPLHCCQRCNQSHMMQSAYGSDLVECAKCLRAFHTQCYPAGARDQYVQLNTEAGDRTFEMIICPRHSDDVPSKSSKTADRLEIKRHIKECCNDACTYSVGTIKEVPPPLISCNTCVRSFHQKCCEVETIDGVPIAADECEFCACKDEVPINTPVLALWKNQTFWLAETVSWYNFPSDRRAKEKNFERAGYTVIEWNMGPSTGKLMSIVPVRHLAPLIQNYIRTATSTAVKQTWGDAFQKYDNGGYGFAPQVSKLVYQQWRTSKFYRSTQAKLRDHHGVCCCKEPAGGGQKCIDGSCVFAQEEAECPPSCGKTCGNRKVSTGYVNKKIELRDTNKYGYGVFAKELISKGEFLAEYVGEIIDNMEKGRRLDVVAKSRDFQANNYMMDLGNGLTVDASRFGNISRYINHSCDPNSLCSTTAIYNRKTKDALWYEPRTFIKAIKDIAANEEITFSYQMGHEETLPFCKCGASNCCGYMTQTTQNAKKKENPKKIEVKRNARSKKRDTPTLHQPQSSIRGKRAAAPTPSPVHARRTSPRGQSLQDRVPVVNVPVLPAAPVLAIQAPVPAIQAPVLAIQAPVLPPQAPVPVVQVPATDELAGSPVERKRARVAKKRFQVEGY